MIVDKKKWFDAESEVTKSCLMHYLPYKNIDTMEEFVDEIAFNYRNIIVFLYPVSALNDVKNEFLQMVNGNFVGDYYHTRDCIYYDQRMILLSGMNVSHTLGWDRRSSIAVMLQDKFMEKIAGGIYSYEYPER